MAATIETSIKEWFVSLKYIVPSEMEYYLEEKAAEGYMLKEVGQMGLFYFEFQEDKVQKCKYVVDISALPKTLYMSTLIDKGWEYLGKTGNCYIWRKCYENERPDDFADYSCRKKHCLRFGLAMLLIAIILLAAIGYLIWGIYMEKKYGVNTHIITYIVEAVIDLPFALLFGNMARKLLNNKE